MTLAATCRQGPSTLPPVVLSYTARKIEFSFRGPHWIRYILAHGLLDAPKAINI
jgi:hypothetical protein